MLEKKFSEIDGQRCSKDAVVKNFSGNDSLDQYKDLDLFYKEYVGEELMISFISYLDLKNKYPIQVIDLRHQVDHKSPKINQLFWRIQNRYW